MTSAVIDLFKDQLNTELKALAESRPYLNLKSKKPDPGVAFPHWYFERIEGFTRQDADEIITDGFDDEKIDAIDISEDGTTVRFFQFKNPQSRGAGIEDAAVDGILTTIDLIFHPRKKKIGLEEIFDEIRSAIRTSYQIIFITSGKGLAPKQVDRVEAKLKHWNGPTRNAFTYDVVALESLLDKVYLKNIPTVNSNIEWKLDTPPYQTRINDHKSLVCHLDGQSLAKAYASFGEKLMQQNIRNGEGVTPANKDIYATASSGDSENFYFYNNGVTIICDSWDYDQPSWRLSVTRPQIVNGGQTVRQINAAHVDGRLKKNVRVLLRVISIGDNKEFAGNVAVNLNNQTVVRPSFLKSNHPFFIQMQHSLLPLGWYFERKQGDWTNLSDAERADLLSKIKTESHVLQMQTGCQAYCAVFLQDIDLAKRNPKLIFLPKRNGGRFEDIATAEFTAQKLILACRILGSVDEFKAKVRSYRTLPATKQRAGLRQLLSTRVNVDYESIARMLPQAGLFIAALVGHQLGEDWRSLPSEDILDKMIGAAVLKTMRAGQKREATWPTMLKSQNFFDVVKSTVKVVARAY